MSAGAALRRHAQARALKLAWSALGLLSPEASSNLGAWLFRALGPKLGRHRIARDNMGRAFPDACEDQIARWLDGMWDNLGRTFFEMPHLARLQGEPDRVEIEGLEIIERLRDSGRPGLFFSGHLANWEVCPGAVARQGLPMHVFFRAPNTPLADRLYRTMRRTTGGELLPKGARGARRALWLLKRNQHLGVLVDQKMNDGIAVPFFGRDAMTAPALATLALKFKAPATPIRVVREGAGRFRVLVEEPLEVAPSGDARADALALMTRVNATLERWIRERPSEWLWPHRRWPKD